MNIPLEDIEIIIQEHLLLYRFSYLENVLLNKGGRGRVLRSIPDDHSPPTAPPPPCSFITSKWKGSDCPDDLSHYIHLLLDFTPIVSTAKSAFYPTKINSSGSNPRKLFSVFSSLLTTSPPPHPSSFTADGLVTYFTQKGKDLSSSLAHSAILPPPIPTSVP